MHIFCANANETHINRVNRIIETAHRTNAPCLGYYLLSSMAIISTIVDFLAMDFY